MRGKGEGGVYKDVRTGLWVGTVELPRVHGARRRKVVRRKDKRQLLAELARLKADVERIGDIPTASTLTADWFEHWLTSVVAREVRPNTLSNYRTVAEKYIVPTIGRVKLDKLTPTHVRRVTESMLAAGRSSTYALNAHRILSSSLEVAVREGIVYRNVAKLVSAPKRAATNLQTLSLDEALAVLASVAHDDQLGARWATSLLTGARRGEVIGIEFERIGDDLDLSWQLQRIVWKHGCGLSRGVDPMGRDSWPCGEVRGTDCPDRRFDAPADHERRPLLGGLYLTRPKSAAGWRIIPLVEPLRSILDAHIAAAPPNPWGLAFTHRDRPIDPDQDSRAWHGVLERAGITKDVRLHDARHTTVDLLYAAGVPEDIIVRIIGHSTVAMARSYRAPSDRARLVAAMQQFSAQFMPDRSLPGTRSADGA